MQGNIPKCRSFVVIAPSPSKNTPKGQWMTRRLHFCLFFAKALAVGTAALFPPYFLTYFFFSISLGEGWGEGRPMEYF